MTRILTGAFSTPVASTAEAFRAAYFDTVSQEDFDNALRTNAIGPYWLSFAFLPLLEKWKEYEGGTRKFAPQIVMTSSMNGWTKARTPLPCPSPVSIVDQNRPGHEHIGFIFSVYVF